jgi:exodeoxyribonuclease VII small subunit
MAKRTYREIKAELDDVIEQLQDPDTEIDQALKLYEKSQKLIAELEAYIGSVKKQINKDS